MNKINKEITVLVSPFYLVSDEMLDAFHKGGGDKYIIITDTLNPVVTALNREVRFGITARTKDINAYYVDEIYGDDNFEAAIQLELDRIAHVEYGDEVSSADFKVTLAVDGDLSKEFTEGKEVVDTFHSLEGSDLTDSEIVKSISSPLFSDRFGATLVAELSGDKLGLIGIPYVVPFVTFKPSEEVLEVTPNAKPVRVILLNNTYGKNGVELIKSSGEFPEIWLEGLANVLNSSVVGEPFQFYLNTITDYVTESNKVVFAEIEINEHIQEILEGKYIVSLEEGIDILPIKENELFNHGELAAWVKLALDNQGGEDK